MAGRGSRFSAEYPVPKPLIPVNGKPMVVRATDCMPPHERLAFVCVDEHLANFPIEAALLGAYPDATIVAQKGWADGQACSCEIGVLGANLPLDESLLLSNCDQDLLYNHAAWQRTLDAKPDVIIWTFRHTPCTRDNPTAYGWIDCDMNGRVRRICPKIPISDTPWEDHAETGLFWFREAQMFLDGLAIIKNKKIKTRGEYYTANVVAELIAGGANVRVFEVERFICWGTVKDMQDYEYWQSYFARRAK